MCLILTSSESFAIGGGPPYPGGGTNVIGRYAGVLVPPFCPLADPSQCPTGFNSLGLFTLVVPQTGLGTGTAFIFTNGRTFTGTITGSADPNTAAVSGVLDTAYLTVPLGSSGTPRTCATAGGRVTATIGRARGATIGVSSILLRGTAAVAVSCEPTTFGCPADCVGGTTAYQINGFKQSNNPL